MNSSDALDALAAFYGINPRFFDLSGAEHATSPETKRALLRANGVDVSSEASVSEALAAETARRADRWFPEEIVIESESEATLGFGLGAEWTLTETGADEPAAEGRADAAIVLPAVPSGIYELEARAGGRVEHVTVLAAPKRLPSVQGLTGCRRLWGISLALYGLQSDRNAGMGDFADLALAAETFGRLGAGFVGVNPVHSMGYLEFDTASPYSPSHRGFFNTAYIAPDRLPGLENSEAAQAALAEYQESFARYRSSETVPHGPLKRAQQKALEALFGIFREKTGGRAAQDFEVFRDLASPEIMRFARYEALSEDHGADWRTWPREIDTADADPERVDYHLWLQWAAERQLQRAQTGALDAGMPLGLYLDLAVGPRRDGAEAWCEQASIAEGVSVGAPPDHLNPEGQRWNLAAFAPALLRKHKYAPFRQILAATMRHAGVVRIDHVLGLYRSFWIPDDGSPGAYISQHFESLIAVIKIEAERNGTAVIGEDLGLVPDGFRDTMRDHGFYGYSVLQYEKAGDGRFRDPDSMSPQVLSCFSTHDTPTLRGYARGRDIDWWQKLGWVEAGVADDARDRRREDIEMLKEMGGDAPCGVVDPQDDADRLQNAVQSTLARSPAAMVCIQLDDVLGSVEAQNLPGTVEQHPNWQRRHGVPVDQLADHQGLASLAACMERNGRSANPPSTRNDEDDP
ncbi:4-alpha-glucanotransferase [Sulfitobacter sp. LCG007]